MNFDSTSTSNKTTKRSSMFTKDFSIFGTRQRPKTAIPPVPPLPQQPPEPPKPQKPIETVHHSTLLLLEQQALPQAPPGYLDNKNINECPPTRIRGGKTTFTPESAARQAENRERRYIRERKAEREARSRQEGWLEGPAQRIAESLEEIENVRGDLRDAARWENLLLEKKEMRKAEQKGWFAGKEPEDELRAKREVEVAAKGVMAMEWTRAHELPTFPASSAASIRSVSNNRNSMLSTTSNTTATTARSSIMSNASSPASSSMPSPVLSTASKDSGPSFWRRRVSSEEKIAPLKLSEEASK